MIAPFLQRLGILSTPQDIYDHLENDRNLLYAPHVRLFAGDYYLHNTCPWLLSLSFNYDLLL